jgi:hypothetical protein
MFVLEIVRRQAVYNDAVTHKSLNFTRIHIHSDSIMLSDIGIQRYAITVMDSIWSDGRSVDVAIPTHATGQYAFDPVAVGKCKR